MKRILFASTLVIAAFLIAPTLLAQDATDKAQRMPLTVSGTLSMQAGMLVDLPETNALGEHRHMFVASSTNATSVANTNGRPMTNYTFVAASSKKVILGGAAVKESPVRLSDYVDRPITLMGIAIEQVDKKGRKETVFTKITSITTNAPAVSGTAP